MLKTFYRSIQQGATREEAIKALKDEIDEVNIDILRAWTLLEPYTRTCDLSAEILFVEEPFIVPVAEEYEISIGFTPDVVLKRKGDMIDIEDWKFIVKAWTNKKINRYLQTRLYYLFMELLGYNISRSRLRMFNIDTGKMTYRDFPMTAEEKRILHRDFFTAALEVKQFKEQPVAAQYLAPRTFNNNNCAFCTFEYPCGLEAEGKDASKTLMTMYKGDPYGYEQ
jgi:hypothetical protein